MDQIDQNYILDQKLKELLVFSFMKCFYLISLQPTINNLINVQSSINWKRSSSTSSNRLKEITNIEKQKQNEAKQIQCETNNGSSKDIDLMLYIYFLFYYKLSNPFSSEQSWPPTLKFIIFWEISFKATDLYFYLAWKPNQNVARVSTLVFITILYTEIETQLP